MFNRAPYSVILICVLFSGSNADEINFINETGPNNESAIEYVEKDVFGVAINKSEYCANETCIRKCCQLGSLIKMNSPYPDGAECVEDNRILGDLDPKIFDDNLKLTNKKSKKLFKYISGENIMQAGLYFHPYLNLFLLETGVMVVESPNTYDRFIRLDFDNFCVDNLIQYESKEIIVDGIIIYPDQPQAEVQDPELTISGMYVSSVFLLATLAVYGFLPQLRNLHGKVLMAYVASMTAAFLAMGTIQLTGTLDVNPAELCHVLSMVCYYSILATFFWMNIMSFDIYWTFRGIAKARDINRRGENHKFLMYCLYGFGCPLIMTIIFAILNYLPMDKINTAVITPGITNKACFISKIERLLYLYAPMSVLILANCVLFVATTCNLCAVRRATRTLRSVDSAVQRATQHRFVLYMKVFLVMGLSWALEVISSFSPQLTVWKFTDAWNLLVGVLIFFIFVCKKKIYRMLMARYHALRYPTPAGGRRRGGSRLTSTSTTSSSLDHDAFPTEVVTLNPKGQR